MSHITTKPTLRPVRPAKAQISLGIHPVWSESSLSAWRKIEHSKNSDQIRQILRLIWVFIGCKCHFVVLRLSLFSMLFVIDECDRKLSDLSCLMTKPSKWPLRPAKISLSIHPVWFESSLCAQWVRNQAFFIRTVNTLIRLGGCPGWSESSLDAQTLFLVLSWGGSYVLSGLYHVAKSMLRVYSSLLCPVIFPTISSGLSLICLLIKHCPSWRPQRHRTCSSLVCLHSLG